MNNPVVGPPNESIWVSADTTGRFHITVREDDYLRKFITQQVQLEKPKGVPYATRVEYQENGFLLFKMNEQVILLEEEAQGQKQQVSTLPLFK